MAGDVVYHWKHGWIPLDHAAALSHAKGNHEAAKAMLSGIPREHLRRSSNIMAARAPGGRVALLDKNTGQSIGISENHAASFHSQGFTITAVNHSGSFTARSDHGGSRDFGRDGRALDTSRSSSLDAQAAEKRAEADRIAGSVGAGDRAAGRLSPAGLAQFHRNTDSALQRHTAAMNAAENLHHKAGLAHAREQEAARVRLTPEQVKGATHVQDRFGWHEVVRVNAKTVTVKTGHSWNDSIPLDKIHAVGHPIPGQPGKIRVTKPGPRAA